MKKLMEGWMDDRGRLITIPLAGELKSVSSHRGFLTYDMYHHRETVESN